MKRNNYFFLILILLMTGVIISSCQKNSLLDDPDELMLKKSKGIISTTATSLTPIEELGKNLFFDESLSVNGKMSCATCHAPEVGFTEPDQQINITTVVYPGTIHVRFGNRKPPSAAYGGDSPVFYYDGTKWIGGMFWDGRATGLTLDDPLAEQAMGPFLNPA